MFYSVPCEYLKQKVEVRLTQRTVEVLDFSETEPIAEYESENNLVLGLT